MAAVQLRSLIGTTIWLPWQIISSPLFAQSTERDAKETREKKKWPREILLAPRIPRGHFSFAGFFRVSHDGLSKQGTTRSLLPYRHVKALYKLIRRDFDSYQSNEDGACTADHSEKQRRYQGLLSLRKSWERGCSESARVRFFSNCSARLHGSTTQDLRRGNIASATTG